MSAAPALFRNAVRSALREVADPARAEPMRAYMKSEMPFLGIATPVRRRAVRALLAGHRFDDREDWQSAVLEVWRGATHREERYVAVDLAIEPAHDGFRTMSSLPMFEEMIVEGAWWDYIDGLAGHGLGSILSRHPAPMARRMRQWSRAKDLWKRRSAILCQLTKKQATDLDLLRDVLEPNLERPEFWLRKAIGWALRQYAWTDRDWVIDYVERHADRLSGLSRREALKNVR